MSGISPSKVTFLTVPWTENEDHATISWDRAKADQIWQAMKDDTGWPPPPTVPQGQKALTVAPDFKQAREYLGEAYVQAKDLDKAKAELAEIEKLCGNQECEEYKDLAEAIATAGS